MAAQKWNGLSRCRPVQLTLFGIAMLYWGGCSTAKPAAEPQRFQQSQKAEVATKPVAKAAVGQSSSLDQLQQGKPVGTAPSSPLKDIYFDFDRYDLRADARTTLQVNAEWLKQNSSATVQIEGHCDERGTAEYNLALGAKRAATAKDYVAALGVSPQRLSTISYGEELPVCHEHNDDCWQNNRHDRFVIKPGPTN